jgi:hypothetical protein
VYRSEPHSGQCRYASATSPTAMLAAISGSESDHPPEPRPPEPRLSRGAMLNAEIPRHVADRGPRQV